MRKPVLIISAILVFLSVDLLAQQAKKPNILFIAVDDLKQETQHSFHCC
ncbi:MAG: hypothetical protein RJB31_1905 [Bacteroidota bacterium]